MVSYLLAIYWLSMGRFHQGSSVIFSIFHSLDLERCDPSLALQFLESPVYLSLLFMVSFVTTTDGNAESPEDIAAIFMLAFCLLCSLLTLGL